MSSLTTEILEANYYLDHVLAPDSTLATYAPDGVWLNIADKGQTRYVVYSRLAGSDITTAQRFRIYSTLRYLIEAVSPVDYYTTTALAGARIDQLLGLVRIATTPNANILTVSRVQPIERYEVIAGKRWVHHGGLYDIDVQLI